MSVGHIWDKPIPGATHRLNLRRAAIARTARRPASSRIGETYGRLTVLEIAQPTEDGRTRLRCACACGGEVLVVCSAIVTGNTTSCGCVRSETSARLGAETAEKQRGRRRSRAAVQASVSGRAAARARRSEP